MLIGEDETANRIVEPHTRKVIRREQIAAKVLHALSLRVEDNEVLEGRGGFAGHEQHHLERGGGEGLGCIGREGAWKSVCRSCARGSCASRGEAIEKAATHLRYSE